MSVSTLPRTVESPGEIPRLRIIVGDEATSRWELIGRTLFVLLLLVGLPITLYRATHHGNLDLRGFCAAGQYVIEHGTRNPASVLSRYWPSADVPWMLLARLPIALAACVWYVVGCATWVGLLRSIDRSMLGDVEPVLRRRILLASAILAMPLAIDGLCLGTFHILMVWLMVEGLDRACRGRTGSGGVLLGLAVWLKLLPLLGVAFLLLQRKTRAALIALAVAVGLDVVLSVAAFGPAIAWQEHVTWWQQGATGTTIRQLTSPWHEDEDRLTNQSVAIMVRRLFSTLGSTPDSPRRFLAMAHLDGVQIEGLFAAITALIVGAVVAFCRPARRGRPSAPTPPQIAMAVLATLWLSPVMWSYHMTAATPALALVLKRFWGQRRGRLAVVVWMACLCLLAIPIVRAAGVLLWLSVATGAVLAMRLSEKADLRSPLPPGEG
jgi:alpha-1,2-mannosyltransferase